MPKKIFYAVILIFVLLCGCGERGNVSSALSSQENAGSYYVGALIGGDVFDLPAEGGAAAASVQCKSKTVELTLSYAGPNTRAPALTIDGRPVAIRECWGVSSAQALDDLILLVVNSGGDVTGMNFYVIDTGGNVLLHIHDLDGNGMYLTHFDIEQYGYIHFRIEGDRLIFQGTRRYHGPSIFAGTSNGIAEIELRDGYGNLTDNVDKIPDDEVIERRYEMRYLGDGKFGPLAEGEVTMTYEEFKQTLYEDR